MILPRNHMKELFFVGTGHCFVLTITRNFLQDKPALDILPGELIALAKCQGLFLWGDFKEIIKV